MIASEASPLSVASSIAFLYAGRAWIRWSQFHSPGLLASSPPRAVKASTGKLIWMSVALNASPANHSRCDISLSIHARWVASCGSMKPDFAFAATAFTMGLTKMGIGLFGNRVKTRLSSSGDIADPSA